MGNNLDKRNNQLKERCQLLEQKLNDVHEWQTEQKSTTAASQHNNAKELFLEVEDRHRRRDYLIVSGLPESSKGSVEERLESDKTALSELCCSLDLSDINPLGLKKIGRINPNRPRLLRFKCRDLESRTALLRRCQCLRNSNKLSNTYINPDLTPLQRLQNRALRTELQRRKQRRRRSHD